MMRIGPASEGANAQHSTWRLQGQIGLFWWRLPVIVPVLPPQDNECHQHHADE